MSGLTGDLFLALSELLDKGWRFRIAADGARRWEVELVGKGLAHWRACDNSFSGAAAAAIKGATEIEDDPFVVIGRNARALFDLVRDSFGTAVNFEIGPAPSDDGFGPKTIEVAVHPWPGQTPAGQVDLEMAFLARALRELPQEIARPLRITTRWPEDSERSHAEYLRALDEAIPDPPRSGGAPMGSADEMSAARESQDPARSAGEAPADEHLSIAGILWKGIKLLGPGWVAREVPAGGAVAVVERTKTGYKARIPACLIGIPLGEIRDIGNLAMVEQAENGDYLVRVTSDDLWLESWKDDAAVKVRDHLQGPARSAAENFQAQFLRMLKAGPEAWTDAEIEKAFPNLRDTFTPEEMGKAMRYARDRVLDNLREKTGPARSADAARTDPPPFAELPEERRKEIERKAEEEMKRTASLGATVEGYVLQATPYGIKEIGRYIKDPARSAAGLEPWQSGILHEARMHLENRAGGCTCWASRIPWSGTDEEILAALPGGEGHTAEEKQWMLATLKSLHAEIRSQDPARSADIARAGEPLADCPICRTNPMPPSHEEDPARSAGDEVRLRNPTGPRATTKVIQFDDGSWQAVPIGWTPEDGRKHGAALWAAEVERALGPIPEPSHEEVRPVPITLRIPPPPTIEGIIGKAMDLMLELGEPAEIAFAGRAGPGATVAWTPQGITVTLDPEHAMIPIPEGFPGEVKRSSDGSITGIWLPLEDAITLSPARSAAREAEKKLLAISYLARKEARALDAGTPPTGASGPTGIPCDIGGPMREDPSRRLDEKIKNAKTWPGTSECGGGPPELPPLARAVGDEAGSSTPMTGDPSRRLGAKNSWDRATHERLTAAVDDLVRGATRGAETDEEITGHLPTAALVAMDPQAIQDLIAWVRRARGTPSKKEDPARSAARGPGAEGGAGEDAGVPPGTTNSQAGKAIAPRARASILTTTPFATPDPDAAPGVSAGEENKVGYEDYVVAARTLFSAVKAFLLASAGEGDVEASLARLRDVYYAHKNTLAGGGR